MEFKVNLFKGTKGKWKVSGQWVSSDDEDVCKVQIHYEGAYMEIANAKAEERMKANALLISKAPELLEMLIEVSKHHQGGHSEIGHKIKQLIKETTEVKN